MCKHFGQDGFFFQTLLQEQFAWRIKDGTCLEVPDNLSPDVGDQPIFLRVARLQSEVGTKDVFRCTNFLTKNAPKCSPIFLSLYFAGPKKSFDSFGLFFDFFDPQAREAPGTHFRTSFRLWARRAQMTPVAGEEDRKPNFPQSFPPKNQREFTDELLQERQEKMFFFFFFLKLGTKKSFNSKESAEAFPRIF